MARADDSTVEEWRALARRTGYRANALSRAVGKSPRQLRRYTKEIFDSSVKDWLDKQRLADAPGLLRKYRSVKRAASELGFRQATHFSREFKKYYGLSPSEFLGWGIEESDSRTHRVL
jgi:AraC-like DNA-binding protein